MNSLLNDFQDEESQEDRMARWPITKLMKKICNSEIRVVYFVIFELK